MVPISSKTVLLTGSSGFIGQHILLILLKKGYNVIAQVQTEEIEKELKDGFEQYIASPNQLKIIIIPDISKPECFDKLFIDHKEITGVIHTAAKVTGATEDNKKAYVETATNGVATLFGSILKFAPQITRVVFTSSIAAIQNVTQIFNKDFVHTEDTWDPLQWDDSFQKIPFYAYAISKIESEKAAWKFVKDHKVNFKLSVVCPPYVIGPLALDKSIGRHLPSSADIVNRLLYTKQNTDSDIFFKEPFGYVGDVRDVALAHVLSLGREEAIGQRWLPISGKWVLQNSLDLIHKNFPELTDKIAKGQPGKGFELIQSMAGYDVSKTIQQSGITEFVSIEQSTIDAVRQVLDNYDITCN